MSKHLLYIFGEPGIGKSTLVTQLTALTESESTTQPFALRRYDNGVTALGDMTKGGYPGTDALALDVQPKVVEYLNGVGPGLVLAEGDRLANAKFFQSVLRSGYTLWPVWLTGRALAAQRRRERGSKQDPRWIGGRHTKCMRLAENFDAMEISPTLGADFLVKLLPGPVAQAFR